MVSTAVVSAAGCGYGGCGPVTPTPLPRPTVGVLTTATIHPGQTTNVTVTTPSSPTHPLKVKVSLTIPAGTVPAGSTLVLSQLSQSLPPLYRVNNHFVFVVPTLNPRVRQANVRTVAKGLPTHFDTIDAIYFGVYRGSVEVLKFKHAITLRLVSPAIHVGDPLFETAGQSWVEATNAVVTNGAATVHLTSDHAIEVIHLLPSLPVIHFADNKGSGYVANRFVAKGTTITLPKGIQLFRHGYLFAGWSENGHSPVLESRYLVTHSTTLHAVWKRGFITLTYRVIGGRGKVTGLRVYGDHYVKLSSGSHLHRRGYVFSGWSVNGNPPASSQLYPLTHSVVLYAIWRRVDIIRYDLGTTYGTIAPQKVLQGERLALNPGLGFSRSGYSFAGWSVDGKQPVLTGTLLVTQDVTLHAVWVRLGVPLSAPSTKGLGATTKQK